MNMDDIAQNDMTLTLYSTEAESDAVVGTTTIPSNMWVMMQRIHDFLGEHNIDPLEEDCSYNIKLTTTTASEDGEVSEVVLADGPAKLVMRSILDQSVNPAQATEQLFGLATALMETSELRGIIVATIFPEQKPAAFAILNPRLGEVISEEDVNALAKLSEENTEMFREKMRAQGYTFTDDSSIIAPDGSNTKIVTS